MDFLSDELTILSVDEEPEAQGDGKAFPGPRSQC